jgi:hypothetical protein
MHSNKLALCVDTGTVDAKGKLCGWLIIDKASGDIINFLDGNGKGPGWARSKYPGITEVTTLLMIPLTEYLAYVEYWRYPTASELFSKADTQH